MAPRRRMTHPFTRLAMAMRVAALNIGHSSFRAGAKREAETIPVWNCERGTGKRAEMARLGRALLLTLPGMTADKFEETALLLRDYADAVGSRFEVASEVSLGDRLRRRSA